jgi:carbamoyl-phosphate synthase large subunit
VADIPRVLITGTGGPSGISFMRALDGEPLDVYSADIDPYAAGLYLVPEERRRIVPRGDSDDFVEAIFDLCEAEGIDVLVPTVDSELIKLAAERERLAEAGVALVLPREHTLRMCLDKWELYQRCEGAIRRPETWLVDASFDPAGIELPVIVKPRSGSGSRGIALLSDRAELERLPRDSTLLVQENLPGTEYSLDTLARADGRVIAVVPRARLKVDSGIAITGRTVRDDALQAAGKAVAERIGLTSVANVQVKEAVDGEPALLEVNPRFPGTMPLTVAAGINMPKLCVDDALGNPMPDEPLPFAEIAMVRYFNERFFDFEEIARMQASAERVHA